jgi:hypothetical protein
VFKKPTSPIPFVPKVKKMVKVDGPDTYKTKGVKLELFMDPENLTSK